MRKLFAAIALLVALLCSEAWAATRTISVAGGNWNSVGSWDEGAFPVAGDAVVARGGGDSGNVTINVASACASIILTNYSGTLTYNNTLTTTSTVTYPAGMTIAGTSDHVTVTTSTITVNAVSGLTGGLRLGGSSQTYTLGSDIHIGGTLLFNATNAISFSGAYDLYAAAFSDTMTVSAIAMSGDITISGDAAFSSATSTTFTGAKNFQAATSTVSGGQTVTLTNIGSMTITGLTTSSTVNVFTGGTWNTGGLTVTGATTGTTLFNITGGTVTLTAALSCSMTFAGDVTWASATNLYAASGTPTLTYSSGTITVGTSVLSIASSCTIAGGMPLYSLTITAAATLTINGAVLSGTGTLTGPNAAVTFGGAYGWTFATVANTAISSSAKTYTFGDGRTYTVTSEMNFSGASATLTLSLFSGSAAGCNFVLQSGATQDVGFVNPKWLTNPGEPIFTYKGTVTTSTGWLGTATFPLLSKVSPNGSLLGVTGTQDLPVVGNLRDTDTLEGNVGTLLSDKILKSNATGSGAGNYDDDNLSVGNVRPVAFGLSQTGDLSNLVATDAAYVTLENSRNNDNGTVEADINTGKSVKIRNVTITGSDTGGSCDYPIEANVKKDIVYGSGVYTGTYAPALSSPFGGGGVR